MPSNLSCFKHRSYKGESAPDLSCKTCCTIFVGRIRAEQASQFEALQTKMNNSFTPLKEKMAIKSDAHPQPKFDTSWI